METIIAISIIIILGRIIASSKNFARQIKTNLTLKKEIKKLYHNHC